MSNIIVIHDDASLHNFVTNTSLHTKIPPSQLKTAISKGKSYSHIKAYIAALETEAGGAGYDIKKIEAETPERILSQNEISEGSKLNSGQYHDSYEAAEDDLIDETRRLSKREDLAKALAVLKASGMEEVAANIEQICVATTDVWYLHEHGSEICEELTEF